jgi:hypothetical protein
MQKAKERSRRSLEISYVIDLESWSWEYSFSVADPRQSGNRGYEERRRLNMDGTLTRPRASRGQQVHLTLIPSHDIVQHSRLMERSPKEIGRLMKSRSGRRFEAVFSMSADVLPALLAVLGPGCLPTIVLSGGPLLRNVAPIRRYSFEASHDRCGLRGKKKRPATLFPASVAGRSGK